MLSSLPLLAPQNGRGDGRNEDGTPPAISGNPKSAGEGEFGFRRGAVIIRSPVCLTIISCNV